MTDILWTADWSTDSRGSTSNNGYATERDGDSKMSDKWTLPHVVVALCDHLVAFVVYWPVA